MGCLNLDFLKGLGGKCNNTVFCTSLQVEPTRCGSLGRYGKAEVSTPTQASPEFLRGGSTERERIKIIGMRLL